MSIIQPDMKENNKDLNIFQATVTQRYTSGLLPIMAFKQFEEKCGHFKRKYLTCRGRNRGALYCAQPAGSGFYLHRKNAAVTAEKRWMWGGRGVGGVLTGKQSRCWTGQRCPLDFCTFLLFSLFGRTVVKWRSVVDVMFNEEEEEKSSRHGSELKGRPRHLRSNWSVWGSGSGQTHCDIVFSGRYSPPGLRSRGRCDHVLLWVRPWTYPLILRFRRFVFDH